jgi:hypothetical protein
MSAGADPVFDAKKDNTLKLIRKRSCPNADYINENGFTYATMFPMLFYFGDVFDCENDYLEEVLDLWADADLTSNNVYYNKTIVGDQDEIYYAAKTTLTGTCHIISPIYPEIPYITLTYNSHIPNLIIQGNTNIKMLVVAAGSSIDHLIIEPGSNIEVILIKTCDEAFPSSIGDIEGSYGIIAGDEFSLFGGNVCENTTLL